MSGTRFPVLPALLVTLAGVPAAFGQAEEIDLSLSAAEAAAYLDTIAPTNAALVYNQVFMTTSDALTQARVHFNTDPDDDDTWGTTREQAEEALINAQPVFDNLAWASNLPECDFGIQYQQGWTTLLPHIGKMRALAFALQADAQRHLEQGDPDTAATRLATIYRMSQQVTGDRLLISSLVSTAMSRHTGTLVTEMIESGELTGPGRDLLLDALGTFAENDPFAIRHGIAMEGIVSVGWLAKSFDDGQAGTRLAEFELIDAETNPKLVRRLDAMSHAELLAEAEKIPEFYERCLNVWDAADAPTRMAELDAILEVGGFGELTKAFAASISRSREQDARAQQELADMRAALEDYEPAETANDDPSATTPAAER